MPSLHELQRRFAATLFDDASAPVSAAIRSHGIDPGAGLEIYRRQLHATFRRALALEFPVIERLVGSDCFARLAREFQAAQPSRSGDLQHIGAPFAAFLRDRYQASQYQYLAAVAALEWAYQESLCAAAAPAFDLGALREVDPADYAQLRFKFHPACRLFSSAYPVLDIWRANQPNAAAADLIDLASGATRVLLLRPADVVQFRPLNAAQFTWLAALARDLTLAEALEDAQSAYAAFDLGSTLREFVALGVLNAATLPPRSGNAAASMRAR
ncbi:MAG TPA: DNA-binding domain-containing protein [Steroidobacteraceae bacterium]